MKSLKQTSAAQLCHALMNQHQTVYQGIVNVTPDSFSDGGLFCEPDRALQQALALVQQGAQIIDVGGVSTRPGASDLPAEIELQRVMPTLRALREFLPNKTLISLDTSSPEVAWAAAQEKLIDIINDVFAARKEASLPLTQTSQQSQGVTTAHIAAQFKLGLILMHMQGTPENMQARPDYSDCIEEVREFLIERINFAQSCGVEWIAIDPGIGFGKTLANNLQLMSAVGLGKLVALGTPVLIGLSRKSFLKTNAETNNSLPLFASKEAEIEWRDQQSGIWENKCISLGARIIRTHVIKHVS